MTKVEATSNNLIQVKAYQRSKEKQAPFDGRVEVFINNTIVLGAPTWDLPTKRPFASAYRLDGSFSLRVDVTAGEKRYSEELTGLDQSIIARVECYSPTLVMLSIASREGELTYHGSRIPEVNSNGYPL